MRKNPSYTALLRPKRLSISEKSAIYSIEWSYTIIWQVSVATFYLLVHLVPSLLVWAEIKYTVAYCSAQGANKPI